MKKSIIAFTFLFFNLYTMTAQEDQYIWLEEVDGKKALDFVETQNKTSLDVLMQQKEYQDVYNKSLAILNDTDKIAYPAIYGDFIYNFWQDKEHIRGIWRRTTKTSYATKNPVWETLLDIDALSKQDNIKWVYKGAQGLYPKYDKFLVNLSNGGGDAVVVKEFDAVTKKFIPNGFSLPDSKSNVSYLDENTIIVGTNFGEGSMTTSGYPRVVKLWKRGTPLSDAKTIYEGDATDVSDSGYLMRDGEKSYLMVGKGETFYSSKSFVMVDGKLVKLDIPDDANMSAILNNQVIINLKSDWIVNGKTYKQGSAVSANFISLIKGVKELQLVYEPDAFSSITEISNTKNYLLLNILNNVKSELYSYSFSNGKWSKFKIGAPEFGTIGITDVNQFNDDFYFNYQNFLTPTSLFSANAKTKVVTKLKSLSAYFDGTKYKVEQFKMKSKDGEMIPYFVISSKTTKLDGTNPTLLNAYGGFEVSEQPFYSGVIGQAWLEKGGVFVLANIRGGGEFGPKWHQAGLKEKRQNIYNDFHGVAEDLIARKITSSKYLGIMGGSNGGLLMGVAFTQRPDLYNAVVCQVPLLDMQRYNKLLAGASWMGEYGDPDTRDWDFIKKYSPYQNVNKDTKYPEVFFMTSTRDDRVHPGHARKMAAKMIDLGHKIYYYENTEGGHGGSSTNEQRAKFYALYYSYLWMKLKN
ncbi:prolyl oligopeptidase family serine peptidase [Flavobacterium sp. SUN052]|uniref:prolyl oligopeptidase family serine peptidase n=1 Tax=Flavobacterium sp. SUN052 TaxID=3002441 RepID=UPI00237EC747|nr:prolyl oligopeptidase family serine peptidase [Flavobacterium sp. SUN052]MEC4005305.1 prolyl oligopeptidase family serine peptidase [Flavobacterium sp. SUN052]